MAFELFHRLAEADSATARLYVLDEKLDGVVRFRNVAFPEAADAFAQHSGQATPALWDGEALHTGLLAVTARLRLLLASR